MKRWIGEFAALDARGNRFTVEVWREFISPGAWGDSELRTSKGEFVCEGEDGEYEITGSGVILRAEVAPGGSVGRAPKRVKETRREAAWCDYPIPTRSGRA